MNGFQILAWDSEFFGFRVARIAAEHAPANLPETLQALRAAQVRLAYWLPPFDAGRSSAAQSLGAEVMGAQLRYERGTRGAPHACSDGRLRRYPAGDAAVLYPLAMQAAAVSRFAADPRMPAGTASRMYEIWITRSVSGEIADAVFVADGEAAPDGVITIGRIPGGAVIGLVAVDAARRGRGIGKSLLAAALEQAAGMGLPRLTVTTQLANLAACRLYETAGFERAQTSLVAHFWL